jgi:hypothetical protein
LIQKKLRKKGAKENQIEEARLLIIFIAYQRRRMEKMTGR